MSQLPQEIISLIRLKAIQDPQGKAGGVVVAIHLPKEHLPRRKAGVFVAVKLKFALARLVHGSYTNASPSSSCRA